MILDGGLEAMSCLIVGCLSELVGFSVLRSILISLYHTLLRKMRESIALTSLHALNFLKHKLQYLSSVLSVANGFVPHPEHGYIRSSFLSIAIGTSLSVGTYLRNLSPSTIVTKLCLISVARRDVTDP